MQTVAASGDGSLRVWDLTTGRALWVGAQFLNGEWVSMTETDLIAYSAGAWRYAGWLIPDDTGALIR